MADEKDWGKLPDGEILELQWFDVENWDWPTALWRGNHLEGAMIKVGKWLRLRQLAPEYLPQDLKIIRNTNLLTIEVQNGERQETKS